MTDVKRWVEDGASEPVRELLAAAREEQPAEAGVQRTLVALGMGSAVATTASHAAGSAGAATLAKGATGAGTLAVVTKWGAIGALGAMTTFGAVQVASKVLEPPQAATAAPPPRAAAQTGSHMAAAPPPVVAEQTSREPEAEPEVVEPSTPAAAVRGPKGPTAAAPERTLPEQTQTAAEAERMLEEVRAIDRARSALARGDGRGTLAALDSYRSGFSERRFEPEALYLRMEALGRLGDSAGAKAAAERLLAAYPNAPQAARARVVAGR
jgi:hypothetical protein